MTEWIAGKTGATGQVLTFFEVTSSATGYYLYAAINESTTSLTVITDSVTGGAPTITAPIVGDLVQIEDEDCKVTSVSYVGGTGRYNLGASRAHGGTTAAAHAINSPVKLWRDFGNLYPNVAAGVHRIISLPQITHTAEKSLNTISSSISSLVVSNLDRQWNNPLWFNTWCGRLVRFYWASPQEDRGGEGSASPLYYMTALGTFTIDEVECDGDRATIKLVSLDLPLREARSAESVKDRGWFQFKPTKWLLQRLLGEHYHTPKQSPPAYWTAEIPDNMELETKGSRPVFSQYGRPPEFDGSAWIQNDEICRAICYDKDETGLLMGVGSHVWRRDLTTMIDTDLGEVASGYNIVRLWQPSQGTAIACGIAMRASIPPSGSSYFDLTANELALSQSITIFNVNPNLSISNITTSQAFGGNHLLTGLPPAVEAITDEAAPIPFTQIPMCEAEMPNAADFRVSTGPESTDYVPDHIHYLAATGMGLWQTDPTLYKYVFGDLGGRISPGYRNFMSGGTFILRHSVGSRGCFAYEKAFSTAGAIYWMRPYTASFGAAGGWISYRLNRVDCATGTTKECTNDDIKITVDQVDLSHTYCDVPTALCTAWTGSAAQIFVATHKTNAGSGDAYTTSDNRIKRYLDSAVGSVPTLDATIWDNDAVGELTTWRYFTVLEMCDGPDDGQIHMIGLIRGSAGLYYSSSWYRFAKISKTASAGSVPAVVQGPYTSPSVSTQACGFVRVPSVDPNYALWCVDGSGLLLRYSYTGLRWTIEPSVSGLVMDEPFVTHPLAVKVEDTTPPTVTVYGVSAPLPSTFSDRTDDSDITWTHADGKYNLWKLDRKIADRFPLADFSDWSVWDAISKIASATRHVAYFDRRGRFRFDPLPVANGSGADYEISAVDTLSDYIYAPWLQRPTLKHGNQEVYNSATAVPYDTALEDPGEARLSLSAGSELATPDENGDTHQPSIEISCKSVYPSRLLLRCISGGRLLATDNGRRPVFRLETDIPKINLVLRQQTSTEDVLYVDHIPLDEYGEPMFTADASVGDYITIGGTDYWDASNRIITAYDVADPRLWISPSVNDTNDGDQFPYPAGTTVQIISRSDGAPASTTYIFASGVPVYVGHGVTVKLTAGVSSLADEPFFHVGDTLVIETSGLKLEKAERSIQSVVNVESIRAGIGKREAEIDDNRMLTRATALELARYTIEAYAFPHFELSGGAFRLIPWLNPLDVLHVRDPFLFVSSAVSGLPAKTERVYVRSVKHDLKKLKTTVDLRGTRDIK